MEKEKENIMGLKAEVNGDWAIIDAGDGSAIYSEPGTQQLFVACETDRGRSVKISHYIDLSLEYLGSYPPDWHRFVRTATDLPVARRTELLKNLEDEQGWAIDWNQKRIIEGPIRGYDPSFNPTNLKRSKEVD